MKDYIKLTCAIFAMLCVLAFFAMIPYMVICGIESSNSSDEYLINEVDYDGHSYIVVEHPSTHDISAIHNPNCDCNK